MHEKAWESISEPHALLLLATITIIIIITKLN